MNRLHGRSNQMKLFPFSFPIQFLLFFSTPSPLFLSLLDLSYRLQEWDQNFTIVKYVFWALLEDGIVLKGELQKQKQLEREREICFWSPLEKKRKIHHLSHGKECSCIKLKSMNPPSPSPPPPFTCMENSALVLLIKTLPKHTHTHVGVCVCVWGGSGRKKVWFLSWIWEPWLHFKNFFIVKCQNCSST